MKIDIVPSRVLLPATAMILAPRLLADRGHQVRVFADCDPADSHATPWLPLRSLAECE